MSNHQLSLLGCLSVAAIITSAIAADAPKISAQANAPNSRAESTQAYEIVDGLTLSTNPSFWFDIDNDGIKEWMYYGIEYQGGYAANRYLLYELDTSLKSQHKVECNSCQSFDGWINYGDKEEIDAYSTGSIFDFENNSFTELLNVDKKISLRPLDFNNDGRPDFWKGKPYDSDNTSGEIITLDGNGKFVSEQISLLTPYEYYNQVITSAGVGLGSPVSIWSPPTAPRGANGNSFAQIDINNDGYMDFIDYPSGYFLLNTGDGRFVIDQFGGTVALRDFDGDGTNDVFLYDRSAKELSVQLQHGNGESDVTKLYSGLACSEPVWICDFDKDGDLDILAAFNSHDNQISGSEYNDTYLLMFENNGKGSFKRHEYFIEGKINFVACTDYNADGNYELIGWTITGKSKYENYKWIYPYAIWTCSLSGLKVNTKCEIAVNIESTQIRNILPANIDNSGLTRLVFPEAMITLSDAKNTRPLQPAAPKVNYNTATGEVYVSWERGTDKETPQLDLTYALRIGTAPGKGNLMYAYAKADGSRLNMTEGNCGHSTYRRLDASAWPEGTIYVSVQTIDAGFMGSEFSEYATFEKRNPGASFIVSSVEGPTVGDEFVLSLASPTVAGNTYDWSADDGKIEAKSDGSWLATFPTPGNKTITLTVTSAMGSRATKSRTVTVNGARVTCDLAFETYPDAAFDMDCDGKTEVLAEKFYEGDDEGNYTAVKRIFNSTISLYQPWVTDINNDGMPDVVTSNTHAINEGDKSMKIEEFDKNITLSPRAYDFDNDGYTDIYKDKIIKRNTGDYRTFEDVQIDAYVFMPVDYNADGLMDFVSTSKELYINKGGLQFEKDESFIIPIGKLNLQSCIAADIDGNGRPEIVWNKYRTGYGTIHYADSTHVMWSDGSATSIPAPYGYQFGGISEAFDFDNNGCLDVVVRLNRNQTIQIIYFNADKSYHTEIVKNVVYSSTFYKRTDGKIGMSYYIVNGPGNQAPTAPTNLRASQNSKHVTIEWERGTDKETPATGLRYNISIKHKGAEGDGAYFMSPLNGGINGVAVPSGKQLLQGPKITIPLEAIPAGEYEVKVQSVDMQYQQSDFSETLTFTVAASGAFDLPSATMVGKKETVSVYAGVNPADIDFGEGAKVLSLNARSAEVCWLTEGTKTVKCGEFSSNIHVHPALNASFAVPGEILLGTKWIINCDNAHNSKWELVRYEYDNHNFFEVMDIPQNKNYDFRSIDGNTVEFTFSGYAWTSNFALRHTVSEDYGSDVFEVTPNYVAMNSAPGLSIVEIDADGHYLLNWAAPAELSQMITGVKVFRETSIYGQFEQIAELDAQTTTFADANSMPSVKSERYAVTFDLPYGETKMSTPHRPMHLMINKGAGNTWNLSWNRYEGRDIASYRILRGNSRESLQLVADVAGSNTSYSDFQAPAGECFYAVEIIADAPAMMNRMPSRAASYASRSNVVSTNDAGSLNPVTSISIASTSGDFSIDGTEVGALQLIATVSPAEATMRTVDWAVVSGTDVVSVNPRGLVSALKDGSATVRATSTDGSGVYAEVTVSVSNLSGVEEIVTPADAAGRQNDVYTIQGILVKRNADSSDIRALTPGLYIIGHRKVLVK